MVKTEKWKKTLQMYMWNDFYKNRRETIIFLENQSRMYEQLMGIHMDS